jgi:PPOX class probable F420-dependent enzyme
VRRNLSVEDFSKLVERPLVATLATYRADHSVLLSPVWHEWREGGFSVAVTADDVKLRHVRRDPRAGLAVYESEPPYAGVEIRTMARLIERGYMELERRLAERYLGAAAGGRYVASLPSKGFIVRLQPGELRSWDFADEPWG